jgi:hypothetical protein
VSPPRNAERRPGSGSRGAADLLAAAVSNDTPRIVGTTVIDLRSFSRFADSDAIRRKLTVEFEQTPAGDGVWIEVGQVAASWLHWDGVPTDHVGGIRMLGGAAEQAEWGRMLRKDPDEDAFDRFPALPHSPWAAS